MQIQELLWIKKEKKKTSGGALPAQVMRCILRSQKPATSRECTDEAAFDSSVCLTSELKL